MEFPKTLVERFQANRVVPFVGAGVSMSVSSRADNTNLFPSWKQLFERAVDRLMQEKKAPYAQLVKSLLEIEPVDYLRIAEYAQKGLGPVWFTFLKEQFDHRRELASNDSLALARELWQLGGKATDETVLLNQGWAALWLGEVFEQRQENEFAYICYGRAVTKWKLVSPPRVEKAAEAAARISKTMSKPVELPDWQIDRKYVDWLNRVAVFASK